MVRENWKIQFNSHLLVCQLNSTMVNYKASTKYNMGRKYTHTHTHTQTSFIRLPKICFTDLFYLLCTLNTTTIVTVIIQYNSILLTTYINFINNNDSNSDDDDDDNNDSVQ
jgi:hypothetical protein